MTRGVTGVTVTTGLLHCTPTIEGKLLIRSVDAQVGYLVSMLMLDFFTYAELQSTAHPGGGIPADDKAGEA